MFSNSSFFKNNLIISLTFLIYILGFFSRQSINFFSYGILPYEYSDYLILGSVIISYFFLLILVSIGLQNVLKKNIDEVAGSANELKLNILPHLLYFALIFILYNFSNMKFNIYILMAIITLIIFPIYLIYDFIDKYNKSNKIYCELTNNENTIKSMYTDISKSRIEHDNESQTIYNNMRNNNSKLIESATELNNLEAFSMNIDSITEYYNDIDTLIKAYGGEIIEYDKFIRFSFDEFVDFSKNIFDKIETAHNNYYENKYSDLDENITETNNDIRQLKSRISLHLTLVVLVLFISTILLSIRFGGILNVLFEKKASFIEDGISYERNVLLINEGLIYTISDDDKLNVSDINSFEHLKIKSPFVK